MVMEVLLLRLLYNRCVNKPRGHQRFVTVFLEHNMKYANQQSGTKFGMSIEPSLSSSFCAFNVSFQQALETSIFAHKWSQYTLKTNLLPPTAQRLKS